MDGDERLGFESAEAVVSTGSGVDVGFGVGVDGDGESDNLGLGVDELGGVVKSIAGTDGVGVVG